MTPFAAFLSAAAPAAAGATAAASPVAGAVTGTAAAGASMGGDFLGSLVSELGKKSEAVRQDAEKNMMNAPRINVEAHQQKPIELGLINQILANRSRLGT